jgi:hypothetical protein
MLPCSLTDAQQTVRDSATGQLTRRVMAETVGSPGPRSPLMELVTEVGDPSRSKT